MGENTTEEEISIRSVEISFWSRTCEARPCLSPMLLKFS